MNIVTPDSGLLFWMVIIFGLLFFILAKFGFPIITSMVESRNASIEKSLKDAKEVEVRMNEMVREHARMIEDAQKQHSEIIKEATEAKNAMIEQAKAQASEEASKIIAQAHVRIEAEKESALRDIRREVAMLSVGIAEKVLRKELDTKEAQDVLDETLFSEVTRLNTDLNS